MKITAAGETESGALFSGLWSGVARFGGEPNAIEIFGSDGTIRYLSGTDAPGSGRLLAARANELNYAAPDGMPSRCRLPEGRTRSVSPSAI